LGRFKDIRFLIGFFTAFSVLAFVLFLGCASGQGGAKDWQVGGDSVGRVNVRGRIAAPSYEAGSQRTALALPSLKGTRVFVESEPGLGAETDEEGNFFIPGVLAVPQRFVAYTSFAGNTYRQRSTTFNLDSKYETMELATNIVLAEAKHSVQVHVSDLVSGQPVLATLSVWGFVEQTFNGFAKVGPFPESRLGEEVRVTAVGYKPLSFNLNFSDKNKAELYVKLTPLTSVTLNQAPVVNIMHDGAEVGVNESISFAADGFDPDGDAITWRWQVSMGKLSNEIGANTVYTAPAVTGTALITLFGRDSNEAESRAVLSLNVVEGSAKPQNPANRAPLPATSPIPESGQTNLAGLVDLRWECSDPDKDRVFYDIYFAKQGQELLLVSSSIEDKHYLATNLEANTYYIWQVVARDEWGAVSRSAIWQFKTGDLNNNAPYEPVNPFPEDGGTGQLGSLKLTWVGGDPDETDRVSYYVYLGKDAEALGFLGSTGLTYFDLAGLDLGQQYFWQVVAIDNRGKATQSEVWSFTTHRAANRAPMVPVALAPLDGAVGVGLRQGLSWECTDPDGDELYYDVYLGVQEPLARVAEGLTRSSFVWSEAYAPNARYYWQVVARDGFGGQAESPVWSFLTGGTGVAPGKPVALSPANGATDVALLPTLSWVASGDGALRYDVYFGNYSPLDLEFRVVENGAETTYSPRVELAEGMRYYWKVVVRDEQGLEASSDEFSFWTKAGGVVDNTPPEVVTVFPADKATNVAVTAQVSITFSEPVVKATAVAGLSFEPAQSGLWTWQTDSRVNFVPTKQWLPGSYHRLKLAANSVQDMSGNIMHQAKEYSFTMASSLAVPAGYRSAGFPVELKSNEDQTIALAGLGSGKSVYGVVVASSNGDITLRQSARASDPSEMDFHSRLRHKERQLIGEPFPEAVGNGGIKASVRPSAQVGDTDQFNLLEADIISQPGLLTAECMVVSDNFLVYKDNSVTNLNASYFTAMRNACETNIYPNLVSAFGEGPVSGPNGETRTTILITNKISSRILGFFYSADMFRKNRHPDSNERKIIYLNADIDNPVTRFGTIAHEMQHMINFYYKNQAGVYEDDWLNEGLSKYAEEVTGYGIHDGDNNTVELIALSQRYFGQFVLTDWDSNDNKSYGLSYLFVKYLAGNGRYKTQGNSLTRTLVQSGLGGTSNVAKATGEEFMQTLGSFGLCLYLNDYNSSDSKAYGLNGTKSLNLKGTYNGVTMPGLGYELPATAPTINLKKHGITGFRAFASSNGTINLQINPKMNGRVYLFDERP
jgi:hypothetical protein